MQVPELQLSLPYKLKVKAMKTEQEKAQYYQAATNQYLKQFTLIVLILFTVLSAVLLLGQKEEIKQYKKQYEVASEKLEIYKADYKLKVDQLRECRGGEVTIKANQK